jgi:Protein of unknown function (DUF4013)
MDIGKSFSYVFEDPRWVTKVGIGGAILLVGTLFFWVLALPILAALVIVMGYMLTTIKNVSDGIATPLPEWNDFSGLFMKGLYAAIGAIVVFLPAIVLICCAVLASTALGGVGGGQNGSGRAIAGPLGAVALCFQCLYSLYAIVAVIYLYAPLTRFAQNDQLSTFWDLRGNFAFMQSNVGGYVIALIIALVAGFVGELGFILCVIPGFFTWFWSYLVTAHVFGQLARGAPSMSPTAPMAPPPMAPPAPAD